MVRVHWAASLRRDIWGEARRLLVGFDEPNGAVVKVAEELLIVRGAHFASPDDLGVVDIRAVVDPFSIGVMPGRIADDGELAAGKALEVPQGLGALAVAGIGRVEMRSDDVAEESGATDEADGPNQQRPNMVAAHAPLAHVAHGLQNDDVEDAGHGHDVMRLGVARQAKTKQHHRRGEEEEAYAAILNREGKSNQGNGQGEI